MPTHTILHPRLEVNAVTYFHTIPTSACYRAQAKESISRQPISLTDSDYDYILEKMVVETKISLKEMWKFIVMTRKINMSISNKYYMYLSYIYILTINRFYLFPYLASI